MQTRHTVVLTFTLTGDGDHGDAAAEIAENARTEALEDFGPEAWGGYAGPTIGDVAVRVDDAAGV